MSTGGRLAKIEDRLTPAEAATSWLRQAYKHNSLSAYVAWLRTQPAEPWPLEHLVRQVSRGAQAGARGEPLDTVTAMALKAEKDLVFLFLLHQFVSLTVASELETEGGRAQHAFEMLRELVALGSLRDELLRERLTQQCPDLLAADIDIAQRHQTLAARCIAAVSEAFFRLQVMEVAAELLASKYLRGQDLLFPDLRSGMTILLHTLSQQLDLAKVHAGQPGSEREAELVRLLTRQALGEAQTPPRPPLPLPEASGGEPVLKEAAALARRIVIRARAETLYLLGDDTGSEALLAQCLDTPRQGKPHAADEKRKSTTPRQPRVKKPAARGPRQAARRAKAASSPATTPTAR